MFGQEIFAPQVKADRFPFARQSSRLAAAALGMTKSLRLAANPAARAVDRTRTLSPFRVMSLTATPQRCSRRLLIPMDRSHVHDGSANGSKARRGQSPAIGQHIET